MSKKEVRHRTSCVWIATLTAILVVSSAAWAQLSTASINGTVRDPSGGVIPSATIVLHNVATGVSRTTLTNNSGNYVFVDVAPGVYTLEASKAGFAVSRQSQFTLYVNQTATFDFTLNVGTVSQSVTVSETGVRLEASTAELGTVMERQQVNDLPLNGRNFTQLLTLTPGASPVNTAQNGVGLFAILTGSYSFPAINGQSNRSNFFMMDGINDQQSFESEYAVPPVADSIEEFKVQSHNDQAQFGEVMGGIINVVTKSGTNHFRGDVWEFLRNYTLDARNPLLTSKTPLKQNQFGGTLGGPVLLPFYNGRDRTFFFGDYEGLRISSANSVLYSVPTAAELSGNLQAIPQQIYNPFSTIPDPLHPGQLLRTPFPNNQIPANMLDSNMVNYAKLLFPAPVATGVAGINGIDTTPTHLQQDSYSFRIDEQLNQTNSLWFRYSGFDLPQTGSGGYVGLRAVNHSSAVNYGISYLHTFGSTATLQVQFGHNRQDVSNTTLFTNPPSNILDQTGYNNNFACGFLGPPSCLIPNITIQGFLGGGQTYNNTEGSNIYEWKADFTKVIGKHTLQLGFDINTDDEKGLLGDADVTFVAFETSNLEKPQGTGSPLASFLLGVPDSTQRRNRYNELVNGWVDGFYFQDQWKATSRLTVNLGVHYDVTFIPILGSNATGSNMTGAVNFNNGTYILTKSAGSLGSCATLGQAPCIPGGTLPPHVVISDSEALLSNTYDNIQPRIGLAYRLSDKSVIRASYGRFFDNWAAVVQSSQNFGGLWPSVTLARGNNLNPGYPTIRAEDPLNFGTKGAPLPAPNPFGQVAFYVAPNWQNPYADQWLFGIQHQFGPSTLFTANYVGSHSSRLPCCDFWNTALTPGPGSPQSRAPYPYIVPTHYEQSVGRSHYDALQLQIDKKFSQGVAFTLNYTWSKAIDIACDGNFGSEGCFIRNPYNMNAEKSVAGFDLTNIFTANWVYQLPFGGDRRFRMKNRLANALVSGWQLNGLATLTSGPPFTVSYSGDEANTGNDFEGVDLVGNPTLSARSPAEWFNTSAFQAPALYTFGNLGRNTLRADWIKNFDLSLFREFPITESKRLEFRGELFNAFNITTWGTPVAVLNNPNFGRVLSTRSTPRQIQLALKLYF
jgi:hypothetical protein